MNIRKQLITLEAGIFLKVGDVDHSIRLLLRALEKWPGDIKLLDGLTMSYFVKRDWKKIYEIYDLKEKIFPDSFNNKYNYGSTLLVNYHYKEALPYLKSAVELFQKTSIHPHYGSFVHARLGICYLYLEQWSLAEVELEKARELAPLNYDMIFGYVLLYQNTDRNEKIIGLLNSAIEKDNRGYITYSLKAFFLNHYFYETEASLKWYEQAIKRIHQLLYDKRYEPYYYSALGFAEPEELIIDYMEALIKNGKKKEASRFIYKVKFRFPKSVSVKIMKIFFDMWTGNPERAEDRCLAQLKKKLLEGDASVYWNLVSKAQLKQGKLDETMESAQKSYRLNSEIFIGWEIMGEVQVLREDWVAAKATFQKLLEIHPDDPSYMEKLGLCCENLDDYETAKGLYERAHKLDPLNGNIAIDLGTVYAHLNQFEAAKKVCLEGLDGRFLDEGHRSKANAIVHAS